jgi:hypothetical protein
MSTHDSEHERTNEPRFEPWLAVTGSSVLPASIALASPPQLFVPLCAASAFLFVTGLFMLRRQEAQTSGTEPMRRAERSRVPEMQLEDR